MNDLLYIPEDLGLAWINIDSGWDDTGTCSVDTDVFTDEQELIDWIASLQAQGFRISLWLDIGFGGDATLAEHPDWLIENEDGSSFMDDCVSLIVTTSHWSTSLGGRPNPRLHSIAV